MNKYLQMNKTTHNSIGQRKGENTKTGVWYLFQTDFLFAFSIIVFFSQKVSLNTDAIQESQNIDYGLVQYPFFNEKRWKMHFIFISSENNFCCKK